MKKSLGILDSGEFSDRTGRFSAPRIFDVIRSSEARGDLTIKAMRVVASPETHPLPDEDHVERATRDVHRWQQERLRVQRTATTFRLDEEHIRSIKPEALASEMRDLDLDMILIIMRPSATRSQFIENAARSGVNVIVFPPYFSEIKQIRELQDALGNAVDRVKLWLPYRYSVACKEILERFSSRKGKSIAAVELSVQTSPYPADAFLQAYSLPFLDLLTLIAGHPLRGNINYQLSDGLPLFGMQIWHDNDNTVPVLSSTILTTAGGALQYMEPGKITVYSTAQENIQTMNSFTGIIHRTGNGYHEITEVSHDPSASELNGYSLLLNRFLENEWEQDEEKKQKPTLESFKSTQLILDQLLDLDLSVNSPGARSVTF